MCSNLEPIKPHFNTWVNETFGCGLPLTDWRAEIYPTYPTPFIYLDNGQARCELAQFGLVPFWAQDKKKFGLKTYNARSETVNEKPSYRSAWKDRRFGLVLAESFYEPSWETGKASVTDISTVPGELFTTFQTSFYSDPVDAAFKALGVE